MSDSILVDSFVCRYEQIKETRQYMQQKVFGDPKNYNKETDLVILVGDANVCSQGNYITSAKMQEFEKAKLYEPVMPLLRNEYKLMKKVLE